MGHHIQPKPASPRPLQHGHNSIGCRPRPSQVDSTAIGVGQRYNVVFEQIDSVNHAIGGHLQRDREQRGRTRVKPSAQFKSDAVRLKTDGQILCTPDCVHLSLNGHPDRWFAIKKRTFHLLGHRGDGPRLSVEIFTTREFHAPRVRRYECICIAGRRRQHSIAEHHLYGQIRRRHEPSSAAVTGNAFQPRLGHIKHTHRIDQVHAKRNCDPHWPSHGPAKLNLKPLPAKRMHEQLRINFFDLLESRIGPHDDRSYNLIARINRIRSCHPAGIEVPHYVVSAFYNTHSFDERPAWIAGSHKPHFCRLRNVIPHRPAAGRLPAIDWLTFCSEKNPPERGAFTAHEPCSRAILATFKNLNARGGGDRDAGSCRLHFAAAHPCWLNFNLEAMPS